MINGMMIWMGWDEIMCHRNPKLDCSSNFRLRLGLKWDEIEMSCCQTGPKSVCRVCERERERCVCVCERESKRKNLWVEKIKKMMRNDR